MASVHNVHNVRRDVPLPDDRSDLPPEADHPLVDLPEEELRVHTAEALERARDRSTTLTEAVDDDDLVKQHSKLMSPLVWDLAHIGSQEEIWLVRDVGGHEPLRPEIDDLYDAFQQPRAIRPSLPLLGPAEARDYVGQVRRKALDVWSRHPCRTGTSLAWPSRSA